MPNTPEQDACIQCLRGPVDVSAGAGSGKTFTLTQRIAHALVDPDSGITDINQILAITFTKKAASELKGRVRSTLRAEGLFEQARKVDGAWISTIHGMCSRILKASALEIGLDPGFSIEENPGPLMDEALNEVLEESRQEHYGSFAQLFQTYPVSPSGMGGDSVLGLLSSLLNEVHGLPNGFDDLHVIVSQDNPSDLARRLHAVYDDSLALMQQVKESATQIKNREQCENALEALDDLMRADDGCTVEGLHAALGMCRRLSASCGTKDQKPLIKDLQSQYDELVVRVLMLQGGLVFQQLLALGAKVEERFAEKKRALSVLDNGDLIRGALKALENPQVAAQFENKFRLVMVDEFQDTDALQLAIVSKLSGAGNCYLCTVGDAQQSIYRFRGADVALYRAYQKDMFSPAITLMGGQPQALRLTSNFRSHGDILAFVKKVCAQPQVFGQDFLDLQAVYDGAGYKGADPRIFVDATMLPSGKGEQVGSKADALLQQAQCIAEFFGRMRQAGHKLSEMVLLLGATTHADLYAQALRQAGFDCVISGGSLFAKSFEAQHMVHLTRALINLKDTEALANVLMGPLFALSAEEMDFLGTSVDEDSGRAVKRSLDKGLGACASLLYGGYGEKGEALAQEYPALAQAVDLLYGARRILRWRPLTQVLQWLLWQCGLFAELERQGAEGVAAMGNYLKALRLMEAMEAKGEVGPAWVSARYGAAIAQGLKEAPGALNVDGQEAIRIMTIHASKGLEFPIVAMADFAKNPRTSNLLIARHNQQTYAALFPKGEKIGTKNYGKNEALALVPEDEEVGPQVLQGADALRAQVLLQQYALADEAAEGQRLFYVGATRAKEALGLFITAKEGEDPTKVFPATYGDVASALFDSGVIPVGESYCEYGGTQPAWVRCRLFELPGAEEEATDGNASAALAPRVLYQVTMPRMLKGCLWSESRQDMFSYSALEGGRATAEELQGLVVADDDEGDGAAASRIRCASADDDKATDFGLALHRLCQLSCAVCADRARNQVAAVAQTYGVTDSVRLQAALDRWLGSAAFRRAQQAKLRLPEQPFAVTFEGTHEVMEGFIDLLCVEEDASGQRRAYVVDYKTGGQPSESAEALQQKHGLQAFCYAYALLKEGFAQVEIDFVRVEQDDPQGADTLQTVGYRFDSSALPRLEEALTARRASRS